MTKDEFIRIKIEEDVKAEFKKMYMTSKELLNKEVEKRIAALEFDDYQHNECDYSCNECECEEEDYDYELSDEVAENLYYELDGFCIEEDEILYFDYNSGIVISDCLNGSIDAVDEFIQNCYKTKYKDVALSLAMVASQVKEKKAKIEEQLKSIDLKSLYKAIDTLVAKKEEVENYFKEYF